MQQTPLLYQSDVEETRLLLLPRVLEGEVINVISDMPIYEVNDKDAADIYLMVKSHWNNPRLVVLQMPNGERFTVSGEELKAAIENARNTKKY